jgi:hypothetical protein
MVARIPLARNGGWRCCGSSWTTSTGLMRWARRKYKRLRTFKAALAWWDQTGTADPELFAHWAWTRYNKLTR